LLRLGDDPVADPQGSQFLRRSATAGDDHGPDLGGDGHRPVVHIRDRPDRCSRFFTGSPGRCKDESKSQDGTDGHDGENQMASIFLHTNYTVQ
jgi:hypothetical protein